MEILRLISEYRAQPSSQVALRTESTVRLLHYLSILYLGLVSLLKCHWKKWSRRCDWDSCLILHLVPLSQTVNLSGPQFPLPYNEETTPALFTSWVVRDTWENGCNSLVNWEKGSREKCYFPFGIVSSLCYEQPFLSRGRERSFKKKQLAKEKEIVTLLPTSKASLRVMQFLEIRTEQRIWEEFLQKLKCKKGIPWLRNYQSICSENICISIGNNLFEDENISFISESHASSIGLSQILVE